MTKVLFAIIVCVIVLFGAAPTFARGEENIHYRLAVQHRREGRTEEAIEEFRKVLAAEPDNYNAYMQLAEIRKAQGNHRLVIYKLQRALVYNPGWSKAQLMLAEAYAADGQYDRAVREYQVFQGGSDPTVRDSIQTVINGLMARMRGEVPAQTATPATTPAATPAPQATPRPAPPRPAAPVAPRQARFDARTEEPMRRVVALYNDGKMDETIAAVREVLAIQSDHSGAYYYGGLVRMRNGQNDMAKINFRRALVHPVHGPAANFYLGKILGEEGARADAVRHLRASLASASTEFDREEAARLIELYGGGRVSPEPQVADAATRPAAVDTTAITPASPEKYTPIEIRIDEMLSMMTIDTLTDAGQKLLAAIRAFEEGRYDDALNEFRRVLTENPNGPVAAQCIYNAGICLYRLRLFRDAENHFQQFLDRFPNHRSAPRAAFFRAASFQERGDYATSERLFRQFIQNNRNHEWVGRAYERLGDSYNDLGDFRRAMDAYTHALQNRHTTPADRVIINYKLGVAALSVDDPNRAITFFRTAIDVGEKNDVLTRVPDSHYKIADIRFRQRNYTAALDFYKQATRKFPTFHETPWGLFQIAGAHRNLKQYREAVDAYRDLIQRFPDHYWAQQAQWRLEDTIWEHEFRQR